MTLQAYASDVLHRVGGGWASDRAAASDDLVRPFKIFLEQQEALKKLQHEAVNDPSLQPKIVELEDKIAHNEGVLNSLEKAVADLQLEKYNLRHLYQEKQNLAEQIKALDIEFHDRIRPFYERASKIGDASIAGHDPQVVLIKLDVADKVKLLRSNCEEIAWKIDAIEGILKEFDW